MPAVRVELHPAAVAEARAARNWYAERNEGAADAFMNEVDRAITLIAGHPDRWPSTNSVRVEFCCAAFHLH